MVLKTRLGEKWLGMGQPSFPTCFAVFWLGWSGERVFFYHPSVLNPRILYNYILETSQQVLVAWIRSRQLRNRSFLSLPPSGFMRLHDTTENAGFY